MFALTLLATPCPDLPLAPGTTWTYAAKVSWTVAGSATVRDTTLTWQTSVQSVRVVGETFLATVLNWPSALAWWEPSKPAITSVIMCRGDRVWHLASEGGTIKALTDSLVVGKRIPTDDELIFQFPLAVDHLYGRARNARTDAFYAWYVEGVKDSVFTIAYRTLPDHQVINFRTKTGIVSYTYVHHGTVATAEAKLTSFKAP